MKVLLLFWFLQAPILKPPFGAIAPEQTGPANLDFESGDAGTVPADWSLAQASRIAGYTVELRREGCRTGKGCAAIVAGPQVESDTAGAIFQQFPAERYQGKRVRFRAWVKLESAEKEARIRISFAADTEEKSSTFPQKGSVKAAEWTLAEVEGKVPAKADQIHLVVTVAGRGTAVIDDVSFEVM
jgi:hypothetical protein